MWTWCATVCARPVWGSEDRAGAFYPPVGVTLRLAPEGRLAKAANQKEAVTIRLPAMVPISTAV